MQYLTKSRYMAGLQCSRRLWLTVNEPPEWEDSEPGSSQEVYLLNPVRRQTSRAGC